MITGSNAEALVRMRSPALPSLAIDAALFDDVVGDEVRPAGLRYDIAPSTASAAPIRTTPCQDLSGLAATVSVIGGPIMVVASPERAIAISLRAKRELPFPVLGSPAAAAEDVIAIATQGLASATDAVPEISSSRMANRQHGHRAAPDRRRRQTQNGAQPMRCGNACDPPRSGTAAPITRR